jgi:leader peptidase (prepilin peptidase) / N-methyltransferase
MIALLPLFAAVGLLIGSFLNVVAHRLPRGGSLVTPRSQCPGCMAPVRPYDNVPVLSWLLLRGQCRDCGTSISARYPVVEAGTALLWLLVAAVYHDDVAQLALGLTLVTILVPLALIDLDHKILPNKLTGLAAVLALVLGTTLDPDGQVERLIAGAAAAGFFFVAALAHPSGMGMGDVKLAGVLGLFLGSAVAPALLIALVVGVTVGVAVIASVGMTAGRKTAIPFGPFLALGGVIAFVAGDPLVDLYLRTF